MGVRPVTAPTVPVDHCGCCGARHDEPVGEVGGFPIVRCKRCRTRRFTAVVDPGHVYADGYHSGEHDFGWDYELVNKHGYDASMAADRLAVIERHHARGSLVDVGGGLGGFVAEARARGWDGELLEPVGAAVDHAVAAGVPATKGGVEDLAAMGRTFDVVTFLHALEHFPEAAAALTATRGAIAPGGILFVEVPNFSSLARRWQGDTWLGYQPGEHVYLFERETLTALLERTGYEVVEVRTYVPGWVGMLPDGYAHMLGLQPALWRAIAARGKAGALARRAFASRSRGDASGRELDRANAPAPPVPITQERGLNRFVFEHGFAVLSRVEEAAGVGTNLQAVARPRR